MYTKFVSKVIQEKLKAKERALSFESNRKNFGEQEDGAILAKDIQSRTTFVRMCSNKLSVPNKIIAGGELKNVLNLEGDLVSKMLFGKELYERKKNGQIRPISGLKSIEVNYKGSFKAIREAVVNWTVSSIDDLEELTPYFLTVGKTVALDWGWVNSNVSYSEMFNGEDPFITYDSFFDEWNVNQDIFTDPQYKIQRAGGDYDAIAGRVSNFETTLRQDGGFDCVTKVTAVGAAIFERPIDKPANQVQIETVGGDKKKKIAYDSDNIINAVMNLKGIIINSVFGLNPTSLNSNAVLGGQKSSYFGKKHIYAKGKYGFVVDNSYDPNIIWMDRKGSEDVFVKWGWMEDQLLNRYLSLKGGENNDIKMTIRSIDTVLDEDGIPILTDEYKDSLINNTEQPISDDVSTSNTGGNPGYPFTRVNWSKPTADIAEARRLALAQKAGYNDWTPYRDAVKNADRKQLWDNSPELWNVTTPPEPLSNTIDVNINENNESTDGGMTLNMNIINNGPNTEYDYEENVKLGAAATYETTDAESTSTTGVQQQQQESFLFPNENLVEEIDNTLNPNNVNKFLKRPTLIKNIKRFLKPIEPFRFFSTELLPTFDEVNQNKGIGAGAKAAYAFYDFFGGSTQDGDFEPFWNALRDLKDKQFTKPNDDGLGRLRYMWVNIKEIQKAFGVTFTEKGTMPNVAPKGTVEKALNSLLSQLNTNFYNFWNFELSLDPFDPSNTKIIDKKVTDLKNDSITYTKYKNNNNSHMVSDLGIYKFPSFKLGSMVKNQNLSFKIPDSMALTIMYGSNKKDKKNEGTFNFNNPEIMKLFGGDEMKENSSFDEWSDRYLNDITSPNVANREKLSFNKVGSENTSHHSKIVEGEGIKIQPERWWKEWNGDGEVVSPEGTSEDAGGFTPRYRFEIKDDNLVFLKEEEYEIPIFLPGIGIAKLGSFELRKRNAQFTQRGAEETPPLYKRIAPGDRGDGGTLKLLKDVEKVIRNRLNGSVKVGEENIDNLKVDTIIPAELTLEIDGTGGLIPGDVIQTEYIQPKYNVNFYEDDNDFGPFTYFQVVGANQTVNSTTWTTELVSKMRINHIPNYNDIKVGVKPIEEPQEEVQKETVEETQNEVQIEKIDKKKPKPQKPSLPPDTDALDKIDPDDIEDIVGPGPTVHPEVQSILDKGTVNIATKSRTFGIGTLEEFIDTENLRRNTHNQILLPKISRGLGDVIQKGSTYSNLQIGIEPSPLIPPATKPRIPVPVNIDFDILPDETLGEMPDFGDYTNWEDPPKPVTIKILPEQIVEETIKQTTMLNPMQKKKELVFVKRSSTYKGYYWQNDKYLYREPHHPEWRPIFQFKDGSRRSFDTIAETGERAVKTIRGARDFSERKRYWDANIESPKPEGKSFLSKRGGSSTERDFYGPFNSPDSTPY